MSDEGPSSERAPISVRPTAPGGEEQTVSIRLVLRTDQHGAAVGGAFREQGMEVAGDPTNVHARGRVSVPPGWDASDFGEDMVEQLASAGIPVAALSVVFFGEALA